MHCLRDVGALGVLEERSGSVEVLALMSYACSTAVGSSVSLCVVADGITLLSSNGARNIVFSATCNFTHCCVPQ